MKKPIILSLKINFNIPVSPVFKLPRVVYLFIIKGEKLHLIDTGVASSFEKFKSFIRSINRDISEIQNLFLTHSHPDHIGAAKRILEETKCKVYAPKNEVTWIEDTDLQFRERPIPGFHGLVAGSIKVNQSIKNKQDFLLEEGLTLQSLPTPGHSFGSTSYFLEEKKALFCGDAILLPGEIPILENVQLYLNSLNEIERVNPNVLYSSWDKPRYSNEIPEILKKSKNYILQLQEVVQEVAKNFEIVNSMGFCKTVLKKLGQSENIANPLILKSFLACLN